MKKKKPFLNSLLILLKVEQNWSRPGGGSYLTSMIAASVDGESE